MTKGGVPVSRRSELNSQRPKHPFSRKKMTEPGVAEYRNPMTTTFITCEDGGHEYPPFVFL